MGIATFIEKNYGSDYAYNTIYASWWFSSLWGILAILSIIGMIKGKMYKNLSLLTIHISFLIILSGALCTKLFAKQGYVLLTQNEVCAQMQTDEGIVPLPFEIKLDTFYVAFYAGTDAPSDYISHIQINDKNKKANLSGKVSMNNIFSYDSYRFYQSSFDNGGKRVALSVNSDPVGISLSYLGYALFAIGMIWNMFSRNNTFRQLLSHPLLKKSLVVGLFFIPTISFANIYTKDSLSVNTQQAEQFGKLWMLYEGRVMPVKTFANDFTLKLTGKKHFSYLNSEQFLMSWLFFAEKWQHMELFSIENPELQKELNVSERNRSSFADFYDEYGRYRLEKYWPELSKSGTRSRKLKEVEKLNDKIQLINMLHRGGLLQIYPYKIDNHVNWFSPTDNITGDNLHVKDSLFIRKSLLLYYEALQKGDEENATSILNSIDGFQTFHAKGILPSENHRNAELFYADIDFTSILFKINLTAGILSLLALFILSKNRKTGKIIFRTFYSLLIISFLIHTFSIALRTYIAGRLPFSNGFETMLIIAWCAMLFAIVFYKKINLVLPFGFLLSGCTLLVAHLGMMNPQITPLVPVLSSPLLSIHVSLIMLAYTLSGFIALTSLISIFLLLFSKKKNSENILLQLDKYKIYSQICLYPCVLLLGAGIFVGAVWANISWGRYWGWDPKEVWALITFLIYTLPIHQKKLQLFTNTFFFHVFGLVAFANILMTYFGVNYFLGGMHSYAGQGGFESFFVVFGIIIACLLGICLVAYRKYKYLKVLRFS